MCVHHTIHLTPYKPTSALVHLLVLHIQVVKAENTFPINLARKDWGGVCPGTRISIDAIENIFQWPQSVPTHKQVEWEQGTTTIYISMSNWMGWVMSDGGHQIYLRVSPNFFPIFKGSCIKLKGVVRYCVFRRKEAFSCLFLLLLINKNISLAFCDFGRFFWLWDKNDKELYQRGVGVNKSSHSRYATMRCWDIRPLT